MFSSSQTWGKWRGQFETVAWRVWILLPAAGISFLCSISYIFQPRVSNKIQIGIFWFFNTTVLWNNVFFYKLLWKDILKCSDWSNMLGLYCRAKNTKFFTKQGMQRNENPKKNKWVMHRLVSLVIITDDSYPALLSTVLGNDKLCSRSK